MTSTRASRPSGKSPKKTQGSPARRRKLSPKRSKGFVNEVFADDMHAKRVLSLGNEVVGVIHAAVLAIHAIGQAYVQSAGITAKSGVEQIDRLLSNQRVADEAVFETWANFVVGSRPEVLVAMDWMEFDDDNHSTLAVYVVTNHGRAHR